MKTADFTGIWVGATVMTSMLLYRYGVIDYWPFFEILSIGLSGPLVYGFYRLEKKTNGGLSYMLNTIFKGKGDDK